MKAFPAALAAALVLGHATGVSADDQERARELAGSGRIVPLEHIIDQVRALDIEHILEVELESRRHGHYYEVEVVDRAGEVRKLHYDAVTGRPLEKRSGD